MNETRNEVKSEVNDEQAGIISAKKIKSVYESICILLEQVLDELDRLEEALFEDD